MLYDAQSKSARIRFADLDAAAAALLDALRNVREIGDLPLEGYQSWMTDTEEGLTAKERRQRRAQSAEYAILSGARSLGVDLGAERAGILNLSR